MPLTEDVSSLSVWNVWDLPLWAWQSYVARLDYRVKMAKEAAAHG